MKILIIRYKTLSYHINAMMIIIINVFYESVGINKLSPLLKIFNYSFVQMLVETLCNLK